MKTRVSVFLSLFIWVSAGALWSQDFPPSSMPSAAAVSPPAPLIAPANAPAPLPSATPSPATQVPYNPPPGSYTLPPGAVVMVPGQPYGYAYPPPGAYGTPMVVQPPVAALTPAPPMPSYRWSVAADSLFLERSCGGSVPLGYTRYNPASHRLPAHHAHNLYSDDEFFPLAPGLRLEISRTFENNMTFAATFWGLQHWSVDDTIYGDPDRQSLLAYSPYLQLPALLHGLDHSLGYTYGSEIDNVEFNLQFRLNDDDPYWKLDWLLGVRYIYFADHFALTGIDDLNSATETVDFNTANNLIGPQTGLRFVHGWDRFQWEAGLKFGLMTNIYHQHGIDTASAAFGIPPGYAPYDLSNNGGDLSFSFEFSLAMRFRLADHLWLRLGYDFYDITGLALAPRQLGGFDHGGNAAFDGLSVGLQATW